MVMVRFASTQEGAARQWADGLDLAGRRWEVFPMTQLRPDAHGPPREAAATRRLLDSAARPGVAAMPRTTRYTVVFERAPLLVAMEPCGPF